MAIAPAPWAWPSGKVPVSAKQTCTSWTAGQTGTQTFWRTGVNEVGSEVGIKK